MQGMNATNESSAITLLIAESCQMNCELMAAALELTYPLSVIRGYRFGRSLETLFLEDAGRLHHWISS